MTETVREQLPGKLAAAMREKLMLPRCIAKGDGWRDLPLEQLWTLAEGEWLELNAEIFRHTIKRADNAKSIISEAADVANFLAMIVDKLMEETANEHGKADGPVGPG